MPINSNPTIRQRRLARRLRELRTTAGLTHADAAKALGSAESKIGRIENAQSGVRLPDLRALLDAYRVTDPDERNAIELLAREARRKGWWSGYVGTVDSADLAHVAVEWDTGELRAVVTGTVPVLLQIPDYTRALIALQAPDATPEQVEARVAMRRERQQILTRDNPPQLSVIVAESVLHHRVASHEVMKAQLAALIEGSRQPNVRLQVLPREDPMNACLFGPFVIMGFPAAAEPDIVCAESPSRPLYYEDPADVGTYARLFQRLGAAAADAVASRALIVAAHKALG